MAVDERPLPAMNDFRRAVGDAVLQALRVLVDHDQPVSFDEVKPEYQEALMAVGEQIAAEVRRLDAVNDKDCEECS